jgi:hypothetical protein
MSGHQVGWVRVDLPGTVAPHAPVAAQHPLTVRAEPYSVCLMEPYVVVILVHAYVDYRRLIEVLRPIRLEPAERQESASDDGGRS